MSLRLSKATAESLTGAPSATAQDRRFKSGGNLTEPCGSMHLQSCFKSTAGTTP